MSLCSKLKHPPTVYSVTVFDKLNTLVTVMKNSTPEKYEYN